MGSEQKVVASNLQQSSHWAREAEIGVQSLQDNQDMKDHVSRGKRDPQRSESNFCRKSSVNALADFTQFKCGSEKP